MNTHPRADEFGTALAQALPWLDAIDNLATAARALLNGSGSAGELARTLHAYHQTALDLVGQTGGEVQEGRGAAYEGLPEPSHPG